MAPVAILAVSAVAVVAILLLKPKLGDDPAAAVAAGRWDVDCAAEKAGDFKCFQQHYQALVAGSGVAAAMTDMKDAYEKSEFVKGNCHQLVHVVGRAAGDKFGDVAKAYADGDNFCWSGYYHGVMESILTKIGVAEVKTKLNTICAGISTDQKYSFYHYNCVHGLGHGVMAVNNNELFDALTTCDSLTDWWERESCFGGVFMENIMSEFNPDHETKYLKTDDLMYPCNAVNQTYKQQCFLMQTSHALQVTGYDFDRVFALCDKVESGFRPTCYQSLGRDASGNTISDAIRTRDICMRGRDFDARSNCIVGAVKDFVSYYHSQEAGEKLCATLTDTAIRELCTSTAKSHNLGSK
ncbi:MAG TPA: hypothetical protein VFR67_19700 [Pilimelia sp.]|nr:hypothetical protein [Pilimelia sp.]